MLAFISLCILLLIGHWLRTHVRALQWLYLPACVLAGLVGLGFVFGLGSLAGAGQPAASAASAPAAPAWHQWVIDANAEVRTWVAVWSGLPSFLINVVFACLFMGVTLPKAGSLIRRGGIQLAYGQVVAWGQYVVGVGLVLAVLGAAFGVGNVFGGVLPVGFEGGHGTAAGLKDTFAGLGWPEGEDFALASATGGIVSAIVVGMVLVNIATRLGWTARKLSPADVPEDDSFAIIPVDRRPSAGKLTVKSDAIESFTLHVALVGVAILIGYLLKQALAQLDQVSVVKQMLADASQRLNTNPDVEPKKFKLFGSIPMFPLCMVGGLIVQIWEQKFDRHKIIDLGLIRRIQNSALDFLVAAAIATISITAIRRWAHAADDPDRRGHRLERVLRAGAGPAAAAGRVVRAVHRGDGPVDGRHGDGPAAASRGGPGLRDSRGRRLRDEATDARADHGRRDMDIGRDPLLVIWGGWPVFILCSSAVAFWMVVLIVARIMRGKKKAFAT